MAPSSARTSASASLEHCSADIDNSIDAGTAGGGSGREYGGVSASSSSLASHRTSAMAGGRRNAVGAFASQHPSGSFLSPRKSYLPSTTRNTLINSYPAVSATASIDEFPSGQSSSSSSSSTKQNIERLKPRADEPNLYNIPSSVYPEYRPVPMLIKFILAFLSILTSSRIHQVTSAMFASATATSTFMPSSATKKSIQVAGFNLRRLLTTFTTFILSMTIVQDAFFSPSRITTSTLIENQWFPSPLSKFSIVSTSVPSQLNHDGHDLPMDPVGVHYLQYENQAAQSESTNDSQPEEYKFDAIHFNHGFGASSLSWLPAIPSLMTKLGGKVAIAHDAPGFGFTDRPPASGRKGGLVPFSSAGNAALGNALLMQRLKNVGENDGGGGGEQQQQQHTSSSSSDSTQKRVLLFGHSMGSAVTLKMALTLPENIEKTIVLVAPALVGDLPKREHDSSSTKASKTPPPAFPVVNDNVQQVNHSIQDILRRQPANIKKMVQILIAVLRRVILDPVIMYILKRAVGQPNFWGKSLRIAWGAPEKLSDSDALRFQWPAIGKGWESGLLAFTRSRILSTCPYNGGELQLLQELASMENTRVIIVHGTSDPVVPVKMSKKIVEHLEDVTFVEIHGSGHDPFEEDIEDFVDKIAAEINLIN